MESRYMGTALALLATAALLAACGGGGGGGPTVNVGGAPVTPDTGGTPTTQEPAPEEQPETPPAAGGGTGGGTTTGTTSGGDPEGDEENEEGTNTGSTPDGINWNGDRASDQPDESGDPYVFQRDYTLKDIEDAAEDDSETPDVDETMRRADYIKEYILLDAKYARLTAQTIPNEVFAIRAGIEAGDRDDGDIPLIDFGADRDSGRPHPLVAARGVSGPMTADAMADIRLIEAKLTRLDRYLARAVAARRALTDEIGRLTAKADMLDDSTDSDGDGIGDGEAQMKQAAANEKREMAFDLENDLTEFNAWITLATSEDRGVRDAALAEGARPMGCDSLEHCQMQVKTKTVKRNRLTGDPDDSEDSGEVGRLEGESQAAFNDAADYRGRIPGLQAHVVTVQTDIDDINLLKGPVVTTLEAEKVAADASELATLLRDRLTAIAADGDFTGRFVGTEAAEDLDVAGDAVFARAEPEGTAPVAALRAIARRHGAGVQELTLDARSNDDPLEDLDTGLGRHWRMNLNDHAPSEASFVDDTQDGQGQWTRGTFRGIYGTFYCVSASCNALDSTTFGAGWYFTPSVPATTANPNARYDSVQPSSQPTRFLYEDADADGVYEPLWYADYGMWLIWDPTQATDLARIGVATRAGLVGPNAFSRSGFNLAAPATSQNGLAATATYSGTARGLSARTVNEVTASGHFTADVTLNARFGVPIADPGDGPAREGRLGGTVDGFTPVAGQGGDHVNPAWSLTLEEGGLVAGGVIRTGTVGGVTGHWRARGHGAPDERPDGFYGDFAADFGDGAAIGVYSAD